MSHIHSGSFMEEYAFVKIFTLEVYSFTWTYYVAFFSINLPTKNDRYVGLDWSKWCAEITCVCLIESFSIAEIMCVLRNRTGCQVMPINDVCISKFLVSSIGSHVLTYICLRKLGRDRRGEIRWSSPLVQIWKIVPSFSCVSPLLTDTRDHVSMAMYGFR